MNHFSRFLMAAVVGLFALGAQAAGEIKLQKVQSTVTNHYGQLQQNTRFEANVANLAYVKQVYAHVLRRDGVWIDVPLQFKRTIANNREIWEGVFSPPQNTVYDVRYALKYVVNGQTYWDNNGGLDYTIHRDSGTRLPTGVNVYDGNLRNSLNIGPGGTVLRNWVTVRNLAFAKLVRVHYSTDGWTTKRIATATFNPNFWAGWYSAAPNPNRYGFEEWNFELDVGPTATAVQYAVEYVVNGQTYWDNNYGRNYRVSLVRR